ncbi:MAG TPA: hypothetical protein VHM92_06570 [Allosphingosinicella sp.]|nr:hypothetical protein [Allosphingosinicella sp.]
MGPIPDHHRELCTGTLYRFLRRHSLVRTAFTSSVEQIERRRTLSATDRADLLHLHYENLCIRSVDNFLSFVSEVIQLAMRKRPEMLKSQETVTMEEVMNFSSFPNLLSYLIDRTLNRLAYKSIEDVEKFIRERTGVELFSEANERLLLTIAIEMRNIYSHNRGNVSDATLRRLSRFDHSLALRRGERLNATLGELFDLVDNLAVIARRLDAALAAKFHIRRVRYGTLRGAA